MVRALAFVAVALVVCVAGASPLRAEPPDARGDAGPQEGGVDPETDGTTAIELLPGDELFAPLIADPNWPRFSIAHEWRFGTDAFNRAGQVSFGESVAFVRGAITETSAWEVGLQAQLDALFDLTTRSLDLANEDYFVGLVASYQTGRVTTQLRIAHVSSHVGDEYLLSVGGGRSSVTYETLDVLTSWDATDSFRIYGGGGVYLNPSPDFDPVFFQLGAEWRSLSGLAQDRIRPIAGLDLQIRQEGDWIPDVAVLLGLRLSESREEETRHVDLFARAYHGRSPEGQFFRQTVDLVGIGLRLGF